MIPSNFRIEILPIRAPLCAIGTKGLSVKLIFFICVELYYQFQLVKCRFRKNAVITIYEVLLCCVEYIFSHRFCVVI